jgi:hypothetical protein
MSSANLVVVYAFGSGPEADMAKSALEAAGIAAIIRSDSAGGVAPHIAFSSGGFKLLVSEEDADAAREVLDLPEEDADDDV